MMNRTVLGVFLTSTLLLVSACSQSRQGVAVNAGSLGKIPLCSIEDNGSTQAAFGCFDLEIFTGEDTSEEYAVLTINTADGGVPDEAVEYGYRVLGYVDGKPKVMSDDSSKSVFNKKSGSITLVALPGVSMKDIEQWEVELTVKLTQDGSKYVAADVAQGTILASISTSWNKKKTK